MYFVVTKNLAHIDMFLFSKKKNYFYIFLQIFLGRCPKVFEDNLSNIWRSVTKLQGAVLIVWKM